MLYFAIFADDSAHYFLFFNYTETSFMVKCRMLILNYYLTAIEGMKVGLSRMGVIRALFRMVDWLALSGVYISHGSFFSALDFPSRDVPFIVAWVF